MLSGKDITIDKDGSIILNGDKYPLASQAEIDVVKGDIDDLGDTIGDITQTGITGADVAAQLKEINTALDNSKIAVFTQTFNNVVIDHAWGSLYESTQYWFDISSLGLQSPPKAVYVGLKQTSNAVMFELLSPLATSIPFHFIRPNQITAPFDITATALVIY